MREHVRACVSMWLRACEQSARLREHWITCVRPRMHMHVCVCVAACARVNPKRAAARKERLAYSRRCRSVPSPLPPTTSGKPRDRRVTTCAHRPQCSAPRYWEGVVLGLRPGAVGRAPRPPGFRVARASEPPQLLTGLQVSSRPGFRVTSTSETPGLQVSSRPGFRVAFVRVALLVPCSPSLRCPRACACAHVTSEYVP
jgi:hypothetical protein